MLRRQHREIPGGDVGQQIILVNASAVPSSTPRQASSCGRPGRCWSPPARSLPAGVQVSHCSSGTLLRSVRGTDRPASLANAPMAGWRPGSSGAAGTGRPASGAATGRRRGLTENHLRTGASPHRTATTKHRPPEMKKPRRNARPFHHPRKTYLNCPWQCLYFFPLPHGQGSLRPTRGTAPAGVAAFWPVAPAGVSSRPRSSPRSAAS